MCQNKIRKTCVILVLVCYFNIINGKRSTSLCLYNSLSCCKNSIGEFKNSNECKSGCIDGLWGNTCYLPCPDTCVTCLQNSTFGGYPCTLCVAGKYGPDCRSNCPQNCSTCSQESIYDGYPCTSCLAGKYGSECSYDCADNCGTCLQLQENINSTDVCTSCVDGTYGIDCTNKCRSSCVSCTEHDACNQCVAGRYGSTCDSYCSVECKGGVCDKADGTCTCHPGIVATFCKRCSSNEFGHYPNCQECPVNCSTCYSLSSCSLCKNGYFNDKTTFSDSDCRYSCRKNCKACIDNEFCTDCENGLWGPICINTCSLGCLSGKCRTHNGYCSCKSGFKGSTCNECITHYYGSECRDECSSDNCHYNTCEKDTGFCLSCKKGYYGNNKCDKMCSQSCRFGICDFSSGTCTYGCISGYSAKYSSCVAHKLTPKCSQNCLSNIQNKTSELCYSKNGTCIFGCKIGFYGTTCTYQCSRFCLNFECEMRDGSCIGGCIEGYGNDQCTQVISKDKNVQQESSLLTPIAIGLVVALAVLISVIFVLVIKRRRQTHCASENANEDDNQQRQTSYITPIFGDVNVATEGTFSGEYDDIDELPNNNQDPGQADVKRGIYPEDDMYEVPLNIQDSEKEYIKIKTSSKYEETDELLQTNQDSALALTINSVTVTEIERSDDYESLNRSDVDKEQYIEPK